MFKSLLFLILFFISSSHIYIWGHEGHEHSPNNVDAPNSGIIKSLDDIHIEVLTEKNNPIVKIYIFDGNLKKVDLKKYPITANAIFPKREAQSLKLTNKKDFWEYSILAPKLKKIHRYNLVINIKDENHTDSLSFNIELN